MTIQPTLRLAIPAVLFVVLAVAPGSPPRPATKPPDPSSAGRPDPRRTSPWMSCSTRSAPRTPPSPSWSSAISGAPTVGGSP